MLFGVVFVSGFSRSERFFVERLFGMHANEICRGAGKMGEFSAWNPRESFSPGAGCSLQSVLQVELNLRTLRTRVYAPVRTVAERRIKVIAGSR